MNFLRELTIRFKNKLKTKKTHNAGHDPRTTKRESCAMCQSNDFA